MSKAAKGKKAPQIGNRQAEEVRVKMSDCKVENPLWSRSHDGEGWNPRFADATVNARESAIVALWAKSALDDAQYRAGLKLTRLYEQIGATGAKAIDYSREHVEGGRVQQAISDERVAAASEINDAFDAVVREHGLYGWRLLGYACGVGLHVRDMTDTRRERDTMTDNLRLYLDCLARHWGMAK